MRSAVITGLVGAAGGLGGSCCERPRQPEAVDAELRRRLPGVRAVGASGAGRTVSSSARRGRARCWGYRNGGRESLARHCPLPSEDRGRRAALQPRGDRPDQVALDRRLQKIATVLSGDRPSNFRNEDDHDNEEIHFLDRLVVRCARLGGGPAAPQPGGPAARRVIIFVWDGLRADDVTPENMPNYFALARSGVVFADHHAVYPTFTMMNSASIATGTYPGMHGFYGNVVYAPNAKGRTQRESRSTFLPRRSSRTSVWWKRARFVPGQADACFDDASGGTGRRADDSKRR